MSLFESRKGTARNTAKSTLGFAALASLALLVFQEGPGLSSRSQRVPSAIAPQGSSGAQEELDAARSAAQPLQLTAETPTGAGDTTEEEMSLEDSINQTVPGDACKANLSSMSHREKLAFFEQHPECSFLNTCGAYLEPSNRTDLVEELQHSYIYRFDDEIRYTHMAMIERMPNDDLVAVWQAAPSAGNETHMRLGVEGLDVQHILISYSRDPEGNRWTSPQQVPIRQSGALWSPVLHVDIDGVLWLFYSESAYCRKAIPCRSCSFTPCEIKETATLCHMEPKLWVPGGDLKVITSVGNLENNAWSPARTVLSQSGDGGIPKVISNRVTVLSTGEWLLPFWREQARAAVPDDDCLRDSNTTHNVSNCVFMDMDQRGPCMTGADESAGVLVSVDSGTSWQAHGSITNEHTTLIEGSLVEMRNKTLFMVFRTTTGCLFSSISFDRGRSWQEPQTMGIPNPNSKVQLIKLEPRGELLLAYNNHRPPGTFLGLKACKACRTHLHLALSEDNALTWRHIHSLDDELSGSAVRIHTLAWCNWQGQIK